MTSDLHRLALVDEQPRRSELGEPGRAGEGIPAVLDVVVAEHDERSTQSFEQSAQCLLAPRARDQVPRHQHKLGVSLADPLDGTFDGVRAT